MIQSEHYRRYERDCLKQLAAYQGPRFDGPVRLTARYWLRDGHRPDLVNLLQATCDILEKARVIKNDKHIVSLDGSGIAGIDRQNPRAEIVIEEEGVG